MSESATQVGDPNLTPGQGATVLPAVGLPSGLFSDSAAPLLAVEVVNICPQMTVAVPAMPDAEDKAPGQRTIHPFGENSVYLILAEEANGRQSACLVLVTPQTQVSWFSEPGKPGVRFMSIWVSQPDGVGEKGAIDLAQNQVVLPQELLSCRADVLLAVRRDIELALDDWRQAWSARSPQAA